MIFMRYICQQLPGRGAAKPRKKMVVSWPQFQNLGVGKNLSFWKKSLSFLKNPLSFSRSLSFFGLEFFSKCPKKKPDYYCDLMGILLKNKSVTGSFDRQ